MILSVIIPVYNRGQVFKYSLLSVVQSVNFAESNDVEIIVVDDHSSEDIKIVYDEVISLLRFGRAYFFRNKSNLGRSKNYYEQIRLSNSDYCWSIGSDDFLIKHAVKEVLNLIFSNPKVNCFVLKHIPWNISLAQLEAYDEGRNVLSEYLIHNNQLDDSVRLDDQKIMQNKLADFVHPRHGNFFLGGFMLFVFERKIMMDSMRNFAYSSYILRFKDVHEWYPNTFFFSLSFMNLPAINVSKPLVITGDGIRDWEAGKRMESDWPFIIFKVVRDIVELHSKSGEIQSYMIWQMRNYASQLTGIVLPQLAYYGIFKRAKLKLPFNDYKFTKYFIMSIPFPKFYLGLLRGTRILIRDVYLNR
jgi:glycosyltransferase involved in cell wall biosynthesis